MLETSARLLRLLSLLQTRPEWSGPELAERLDVSVRTVRRDVDKLRGLDYPVEVDLGPTGGYRLGAGAALPPLLLDDEEAVAVAVTLQTAAGSGGVGVAGLGEAAVRALVKLERILPSRLRRRVAAVPVSTVMPLRAMPTVDPTALVAVGAACRDRRVLDLDYTAHDGTVTRRRVEPHHLVSWGRRWYLLAHDLGRDDWRTLRLDRLRPRVGPDGLATGPRFVAREVPGGDPAAYVASKVADVRAAFRCRVRVAAPPDVVRERLWTDQARVDDLGDGTSRLHLAADHVDGAVIMLVGLGLEFVVESPDELGEALRALATRCRKAANGTSGGRVGAPAELG
ncbi:WYL domain-containing protein [Actinomycetospora endophytica]|uniref:WYL domain-containing protein n=1 Tax=Actinomycetospora endophytica TaxID=2291215 RepID=A0ABS8P2P6_9PSEU|nr:WYL domain-containing protein [Actinomycetospora endophytica]MCD2192262.1 WYL domain-containing protein [Actinomycetospora endophytica]